MTSEELEDLQNKLTTLPSGDDEGHRFFILLKFVIYK